MAFFDPGPPPLPGPSRPPGRLAGAPNATWRSETGLAERISPLVFSALAQRDRQRAVSRVLAVVRCPPMRLPSGCQDLAGGLGVASL